MDSQQNSPTFVPVMVKSEPGMAAQIPENEELNDTDSGMEGPEVSVKKEPTESVSDGEGMDNPYQCFTCGLDCESQHDLITHYETKCWAQDVGSNEESMEADGGDDVKAVETEDDPLIGDEAPSNERIQNIGQAFDNSEDPQQLLFYCAFCGVASNEKQELMVHMESHIEVTYLSCAHCVHVYSDKYHLKNYKCRDVLEKPHVCVHCPFRTQWWQELKDHCFSLHHRDVNPRRNKNQGASLSSSATSSNLSFLSGDLQPIHSAEIAEQQLRIHNANKDYFVVVKNMGSSTGSGASSGDPEVSSSQPPTNDQYLKHLLVSNSMNGVTGPMLQSPKYLNAVSSTQRPGKRKSAPAVPVSGTVPTQQHTSPDKGLAPVKNEVAAAPTVVQVPIVVQSWPGNVRHIAPRPPEVPGPQNLPTVIPRGQLLTQPPVKPPTPTVKPPNETTSGTPKKKQAYHKNKKIPCPYCEYLSRDKWNLRTHILTHTKEKPFACQLCSYRASQAAHLRKHMHIHRRKMMGQ